jgi:hypothetical protein
VTPADYPALSAALMRVRARARADPGTPARADAAGLALSWLCKRLATRTEPGEELLGIAFHGECTDTHPPPAATVVALLPNELVPTECTDSADRMVLRFRMKPGHFRCRDCGWGDATDAKGTYPGSCAACSAERHRTLMEWTAKPEPETET